MTCKGWFFALTRLEAFGVRLYRYVGVLQRDRRALEARHRARVVEHLGRIALHRDHPVAAGVAERDFVSSVVFFARSSRRGRVGCRLAAAIACGPASRCRDIACARSYVLLHAPRCRVSIRPTGNAEIGSATRDAAPLPCTRGCGAGETENAVFVLGNRAYGRVRARSAAQSPASAA